MKPIKNLFFIIIVLLISACASMKMQVAENQNLEYKKDSSEFFSALEISKSIIFSNASSSYFSKNTFLTNLNCANNQLTSFDVSENTALTSLDCDHNQLTNLDVSKNIMLDFLDCSYNELTSIDVSQNTAHPPYLL